MSDNVEITAEGGTVRAFIGGERVSSLGINTRRLQIAPGVFVECGGIGGVGTPPEHRGKGLSTSVMAAAMEHQKRLGKHVSALYTGRRIVAHRLYRRFGFADVFDVQERVKYLDLTRSMGRLAEHKLARALDDDALAEVARAFEGELELDVSPKGSVRLIYSAGQVSATDGDGTAATVACLSPECLNTLSQSTMSPSEAVTLGMIGIVRGTEAGFLEVASLVFGRWESPLEGDRR